MAALEEQYMQALSLIRMEFDHERELMSECHKRELERLRDIIFAMEQNNQEHDNEAKQEFQSTRDEIKNKVRPQKFFMFKEKDRKPLDCAFPELRMNFPRRITCFTLMFRNKTKFFAIQLFGA